MQESDNGNQPNQEPSILRGRKALDRWHRGISNYDEKRINIKISNIYKVDMEEAKDIHTNYHLNRIMSLLLEWAKKHGMTETMFADKQRDLDVQDLGYQVSMGELIEIAAVEVLYKHLCYTKANSSQIAEDRYINFYS